VHGRGAVDRGDQRLERRGLRLRFGQQRHHVFADVERRQRPAVGVHRGETGGEHPRARLVDRATHLTAEAAGRGGEQRERPPGPVGERGGIGGLEAAYEQHGYVQ